MNLFKTTLASLVMSLICAFGALAQEYMAGDIMIDHPVAKAMLPGQPVGGGYMTLMNHGGEPDRLMSITSPAAGEIMLHAMKMEGDVMKMEAMDKGLEIPAGASVELKPGGSHVMFMNVKQPFKAGDVFKATLTFEKAGTIEVEFQVEPAN